MKQTLEMKTLFKKGDKVKITRLEKMVTLTKVRYSQLPRKKLVLR